jgi:multidrug efflux pump subunit AcrA (membrane-fusion protein)
VQYFAVMLTLEGSDEDVLKIGQRVRATILLEESEALTVPRGAVFVHAGKNYVYRKQGDTFEKAFIELGGGTAGRVIVTAGLAAGDQIALREPYKPTAKTPGEDGSDDGANESAEDHASK